MAGFGTAGVRGDPGLASIGELRLLDRPAAAETPGIVPAASRVSPDAWRISRAASSPFGALAPGAARAMVNYYRALFRHMPPRQARRAANRVLQTPTLLIWGEQDTVLGKELTYGTDELVEDLTLRYLPEASHWVQQDAPDEVNAMLQAWLTGQPVPEADQSS